MRILLGNTGRGGEQCIFSSIVHAYRVKLPDAYIEVTTPPQYWSFWKNNKDINKWTDLKYEPGDKCAGDPVAALKDYFEMHAKDFDIIEYPCEYGFSSNSDKSKTTLEQSYEAIRKRLFTFEEIEPVVWMWPDDQEIETAVNLYKKYPNMIMLSQGANSAKKPLSLEGFGELAKALREKGTVCYTGTHGRNHMPADPIIPGACDLRGISYGTLFALKDEIQAFIGLDSGTAWLLTGMHGLMVTLRNDPFFPLSNTGIVEMGYRDSVVTHEIETGGMSEGEIVEKIAKDIL